MHIDESQGKTHHCSPIHVSDDSQGKNARKKKL